MLNRQPRPTPTPMPAFAPTERPLERLSEGSTFEEVGVASSPAGMVDEGGRAIVGDGLARTPIDSVNSVDVLDVLDTIDAVVEAGLAGTLEVDACWRAAKSSDAHATVIAQL